MKSVQKPVSNENLKDLKPFQGKGHKSPTGTKETPLETTKSLISENSKALNENSKGSQNSGTTTTNEALSSAKSVASTLSKIPILPIAVPIDSKDTKKLEDKLSAPSPSKINFIKKPAVIFIEGFSALGISNGDGIKDMADNLPGAKRFSWNEQDSILDEIKKHAPDQPVILVGHSFGGDTAVEIANTLNNVKNGFRPIDLLVSIDSVGMNHNIIPMNVVRNLNFFGEGVVPFLHGEPNVARNTDYTEVINELRSELHSKMEDSSEVQFKIFEAINDVISESNLPDLFEEMQKNSTILEIIGSLPHHLKP